MRRPGGIYGASKSEQEKIRPEISSLENRDRCVAIRVNIGRNAWNSMEQIVRNEETATSNISHSKRP